MPDILRMLPQAEQLDFSQNFLIPRPNYIGDTIFPDRKTQNFKAEYLRLAAGSQLPTMALVHGLDTEAHIGSRLALERVTVEKLFIKEKINQTESLRQVLENGAFNDSALIDFVYDDWGRLAEGVRCRTEVAKMEVLSTGKMTIKENGLNFSVDFGVPNGNTGFDIDVSTPDKNVLAQIEEIVETARDKGFTVTGMVLSGAVLSKMRTNEGVSKAIYGGAGAGAVVSHAQLVGLFNELFGITEIRTNDLRYNVEGKDGKLTVTMDQTQWDLPGDALYAGDKVEYVFQISLCDNDEKPYRYIPSWSVWTPTPAKTPLWAAARPSSISARTTAGKSSRLSPCRRPAIPTTQYPAAYWTRPAMWDPTTACPSPLSALWSCGGARIWTA